MTLTNCYYYYRDLSYTCLSNHLFSLPSHWFSITKGHIIQQPLPFEHPAQPLPNRHTLSIVVLLNGITKYDPRKLISYLQPTRSRSKETFCIDKYVSYRNINSRKNFLICPRRNPTRLCLLLVYSTYSTRAHPSNIWPPVVDATL